MKKTQVDGRKGGSWDEIIDQITIDANGEDEQLWAFRQAFEDDVAVPCSASVLGESVTVSKFDYDGNQRRSLTVTCLRSDGRRYIVAAADVVLAPDTKGAGYLAAYRKWMGLSSVGLDRQPAVSSMHAWVRLLPLAAGTVC